MYFPLIPKNDVFNDPFVNNLHFQWNFIVCVEMDPNLFKTLHY